MFRFSGLASRVLELGSRLWDSAAIIPGPPKCIEFGAFRLVFGRLGIITLPTFEVQVLLPRPHVLIVKTNIKSIS